MGLKTENEVAESRKNHPFSKELITKRVLEIIIQSNKIEPAKLSAKIQVGWPYLSKEKANQLIEAFILAEEIKVITEGGIDYLCLSK